MTGFDSLLNEETMENMPEEGATVLTTEVVSPQYGDRTGHRSRYTVPTEESPNDFTPLGPYVREGGGVASRVRVSPLLFPSLGQDDDNGLRAGRAHLSHLMKAQKAYAMNLAARDPQAAGMAFADLDGMRDGFNALVNEGWNGREAAHAVGSVGRTFGGFGNVVENAKQMKRYAETRGVDLTTAGNELFAMQKNFAAGYLSDYGFTGKVTPDSAHYENIRNDFSDILSALWAVEDKYSWQFNQATYQDVFDRCRRTAASLAMSGLSVRSIGAENVVRSALAANGSLNDPAAGSADVDGLMASQALDRALLTLGPGFDVDTAGNPYSNPIVGSTKAERDAAAADDQDFGLVRDLRQSLFRHRASAVASGRGFNDFKDDSGLRQDFASSLRMFSAGSAGVSDESFLKMADIMLGHIAANEPTSVIAAARELVDSGEASAAQADAIGAWSRGLTMGTAQGDRALKEAVYPFIEGAAAQRGMSPRDPAMAPFIAQATKMARRMYLDRRTVASLDSLTAEMGEDQIWGQVRDQLRPYLDMYSSVAAAKQRQAAAQAELVAQARERAKDEGN